MERVSLAQTLLLLEAIKLSPSTAKRIISEFQEYIWDDRVQVDQHKILEILRDLAYDLDYFEADPSLRTEDNAFFDEEKLKAEIESACPVRTLDSHTLTGRAMAKSISEQEVASVRLLTLELSEDEITVLATALSTLLQECDDRVIEAKAGASRDEVEAILQDLHTFLQQSSHQSMRG